MSEAIRLHARTYICLFTWWNGKLALSNATERYKRLASKVCKQVTTVIVDNKCLLAIRPILHLPNLSNKIIMKHKTKSLILSLTLYVKLKIVINENVVDIER